MKWMVNIVQVLIIAAIVYPVFSFWDKNRVKQFCDLIDGGMTTKQLAVLADEEGMTLPEPIEEGLVGGKWHLSIETISSYNDYACVVKGVGGVIAVVELIESDKSEDE